MDSNLRPGEDLQHYLERQASQMQERAAALQEAFAAAAATVTSRDGTVTVSLAPNGALRNIQLGKRACELGEARLAATIMETVRLAQSQTARAVTSSVQSIVGNNQAVEMMKSFLPPDPAAADEVDQNKFVEDPEPDDAPPPPKPPVTPPSSPTNRPRRRPERRDDDEEANPW
ncbi:YbaB/EbfC family nucleoid-associated protein [Saccharomonospora sp. NB11]|uniref:YbaB/EbfC family nucleoid-associated protein n=1 Tax=Saccharomonospora sp. NB11 TaxID=1642298 RepID=UPI0018D00E0B|nr:YbaB/EbfC family nucleoid-associated protein [Saccharomonospora sp. NB11]